MYTCDGTSYHGLQTSCDKIAWIFFFFFPFRAFLSLENQQAKDEVKITVSSTKNI